MQDDAKHDRLTVNLTDTFHPYEDDRLVEMQPDPPALSDREPFNDAIRHMDIIVGHQQNRTLSDYPRSSRPWVRLYAIVTLILVVLSALWSIFR